MSVRESILKIRESLNKYILDQEDIIDKVILSLLCNGNILLEGAPVQVKLDNQKSIETNRCFLGRVQFTPDLLPSDIVGSEVYLTDDTKRGV